MTSCGGSAPEAYDESMDASDEILKRLEARVMELEMRSEERVHDMDRLQRFVEGYEQRIGYLERKLRALEEAAENPAEPLPPASEDLPPHY